MHVTFFDQTHVQKEFKQYKTLSLLIQALETEFWNNGEVICQLKINGEGYFENEKMLAKLPIEEVKTIEIQSQKPEDLVQDSITSVKYWVPQLVNTAELAATNFSTGKIAQAQEQMNQVIDGCQGLNEALGVLAGILIQEKKELAKSGELNEASGLKSRTKENLDRVARWQTNERVYTMVIKDLLTHFEARDYIAVADALQFDLPEVLTEWSRVLSEFEL